MRRRSLLLLPGLPLSVVVAACASDPAPGPSVAPPLARPPVLAAPVKVKIYVAPVRLVSEQGPEKPQFTKPLEALLRRRRFEVMEKKAALPGEPPFQPEPGACQLKRVILLDSKLTHPFAGSPMAYSDMRLEATLITAEGTEHRLGPFASHVEYTNAEYQNRDVTWAGAERALTAVFRPLVSAIEELTG